MYFHKQLERALVGAWILSVISTFGSLYFSFVLGQEPCSLCWYSRICMFSLTIILTVAIIRKDYHVAPYGMVLSFLGMSISLFHALYQKLPILQKNITTCGRTSCIADPLDVYNIWITLPMVAFVVYLLIFGLLFWLNKKRKDLLYR